MTIRMDYNQEKIIAEIILKIRFGTATEDEKQQVENWVAEKEEHRLLYEKIVSGKSIAEYLKKEGDVKAVTDIKAVSARVRERIQEKEMGKRRVLRKWYAVTGAACLIGIILGGVFLNHEDRESVALVENNPEQVVNEKVMLVLSDGQTIGLAHQGTDSIYIGQATIIEETGHTGNTCRGGAEPDYHDCRGGLLLYSERWNQSVVECRIRVGFSGRFCWEGAGGKTKGRSVL